MSAHNQTPVEDVAAVVLAGGFGTRIQHMLQGVPKPMAPVLGRPFIEWVVRYLSAQGIRRIVISTGYLAESISEHFLAHPIKGMQIESVPESSPLGTGGGFVNAVRHSRQTPRAWLVLNGDSLALASLDVLTKTLDEAQIRGSLLGLKMSDASRYGTLTQNARGELTCFEEKKPGAGVINAGVYLFPDRTLQEFPAKMPLSFEKEVFPHLLGQNVRIKVATVQVPFLDIGTPESLPQAEVFIRENLRYFNE